VATEPHPVLKTYYRRDDERQPFVTALFDTAARHYDRVCAMGSLGSGQWHRRRVLRWAGLRPGMRLLDVATGTGLVARSAHATLGGPGAVVGLDPSAGMLRQARESLAIPLVQGTAEALPFVADRFDMVTIGYALRHVADLEVTFGEFLRVLKPGGRVLILEIARPHSWIGRQLLRLYVQRILPRVTRLGTGSPEAALLVRYYWDTIAGCVPPQTILDVLRRSGFVDVERRVLAGMLSEYVASKPRAAAGAMFATD
jgi:demethylmenaquinone methyltransferase/2-methoxy-6-polyprenyl-1,4-benzoquinol methylase